MSLNLIVTAVAIALVSGQAATVARPQPRACHSAAASSEGVVVWGGASACGSGVIDDSSMWIWNGATWRQRPGPAVTTREDALLARNGPGGDLTLIGGRRSGVVHSDVWTLSADRWTRVQAAGGPGAIEHGAAAFDPVRKRLVVFGGAVGRDRSSKTYEFDGERWREFDVPGPPARVGHGMAFSVSDGAVLLYGGFADTSFRDLWKWNGSVWQRLSDQGPTFTEGHVVTESPDGIYIVGPGLNDARQVSVWRWNRAFSSVGADGPINRVGATATFDPARQVLVYFGGAGPMGPSAAVHEFDGVRWTER